MSYARALQDLIARARQTATDDEEAVGQVPHSQRLIFPAALGVPRWLLDRVSVEMATPPAETDTELSQSPGLRLDDVLLVVMRKQPESLVIAVGRQEDRGSWTSRRRWPLMLVHPDIAPEAWPAMGVGLLMTGSWQVAFQAARLGVDATTDRALRAGVEAHVIASHELRDAAGRLSVAGDRVKQLTETVNRLNRQGRGAEPSDLNAMNTKALLAADAIADALRAVVQSSTAIDAAQTATSSALTSPREETNE